MSNVQLLLDLDSATAKDPLTCPYRSRWVPEVRRDVCTMGGREVYTNCSTGLWGDPPRCTLEEPDNSPEACARRLAWSRRHEEDDGGDV